MYLKTPQEISIIRESAQILSKLLGKLAHHIKPGITTQALDKLATTYIENNNAKPSFKGFEGYPATLCTSVNEQVVHGIPNTYILQEGDIISIDCGVYYKGYHSDAAFTYPVGKINKKLVSLLSVTELALNKGIAQATINNRIGNIGYAVNEYVVQQGYKIVREYGGHGVGKQLHESPHIPNFGKRGTRTKIKEGMVLAIEPIVNLGTEKIMHIENKWHVVTSDKQPSAHFEHTIAIVDGKPEKLTTYDYIKEALKQ